MNRPMERSTVTIGKTKSTGMEDRQLHFQDEWVGVAEDYGVQANQAMDERSKQKVSQKRAQQQSMVKSGCRLWK